MTDRGRTSVDGSPACPFIAYEDERDERSTEPDHAHRCYAEVRPAPRALAHQEAYCLSSAFPVCPTFQAWARREAAQARSAAAASSAASASAASPASAANVTTGGATSAASDAPSGRDPYAVDPTPRDDDRADDEVDLDPDGLPARRNPPRDWAAPPPWATGAAGAAAARSTASGDAPDFLAGRGSEGQGLAGSAADRLAGGLPPDETRTPAPVVPSNAPAAPADPELAGLVGGSQAWSASGSGSTVEPSPLPPARPVKRQPVSSTRGHVDRTPVQTGPAWEKARRYEAYPTIKTRTGMPDVPRVALFAGALGIAALALFFLPALLGMGGKPTGSVGPSASASLAVETAAPSPTVPAAPTPQVYVVESGDTMTKIAKKFGVTVAQIMEANPTIKDPNKISLGQEIIIPVPVPDEIVDPSAEASP